MPTATTRALCRWRIGGVHQESPRASTNRRNLTATRVQLQPTTLVRDHRHSLPTPITASLDTAQTRKAGQARLLWNFPLSRSLAPGIRSSWTPPVPEIAGRQPYYSVAFSRGGIAPAHGSNSHRRDRPLNSGISVLAYAAPRWEYANPAAGSVPALTARIARMPRGGPSDSPCRADWRQPCEAL